VRTVIIYTWRQRYVPAAGQIHSTREDITGEGGEIGG